MNKKTLIMTAIISALGISSNALADINGYNPPDEHKVHSQEQLDMCTKHADARQKPARIVGYNKTKKPIINYSGTRGDLFNQCVGIINKDTMRYQFQGHMNPHRMALNTFYDHNRPVDKSGANKKMPNLYNSTNNVPPRIVLKYRK